MQDFKTYAQKKRSNYSYNSNNRSFMRGLVETERTAFAEIIGDDKRPDLHIPQMKLAGWDNTSNVSIRVKHEGEPTAEDRRGRLVFCVDGNEHEFYAIEHPDRGGVEFATTLFTKPKKNVVEYTVRRKNARLYYQRPLTSEDIAEGMQQDENVAGSFAVYSDFAHNDLSTPYNYMTGKIAHIYRPFAIDANGARVWCNLEYDERRDVLSVVIPYDFYATAAYPLYIDPTFGYTSVGASTSGNAQPWANQYTATGSGNVNKISVYGVANTGSALLTGFYSNGGTKPATGGLIAKSALTAFTNTVGWFDTTYSTGSVTSGTVYWLCSNCGGGSGKVVTLYFDWSQGSSQCYDTNYNYTAINNVMPNANTWTIRTPTTLSHSLYMTFTPSARRRVHIMMA